MTSLPIAKLTPDRYQIMTQHDRMLLGKFNVWIALIERLHPIAIPDFVCMLVWQFLPSGGLGHLLSKRKCRISPSRKKTVKYGFLNYLKGKNTRWGGAKFCPVISVDLSPSPYEADDEKYTVDGKWSNCHHKGCRTISTRLRIWGIYDCHHSIYCSMCLNCAWDYAQFRRRPFDRETARKPCRMSKLMLKLDYFVI